MDEGAAGGIEETLETDDEAAMEIENDPYSVEGVTFLEPLGRRRR
jgi:hypothetical protein